LICGFTLSSSAPAARYQEPVAIVYRVSGTASATTQGVTRPIALFTRLAAGAVILTDADGNVALAFANGNRCEIGSSARVSLTEKACVGPARSLSSVPPLPFVPRTVSEATEGTRFAAVRVRANEIRGMYPHDGTATLADETTLRFAAQDGAEHQVRVLDQRGSMVFESTTRSGTASVPPGVLKAGATYSWIVRALVLSGPPPAGRAQFATVSAEAASRRQALRKSILQSDDPSDLALLAGIDLELGLLREAGEEMRRALAADPRNGNLQESLDRIERAISTDKP
jgi:hypothetical protein